MLLHSGLFPFIFLIKGMIVAIVDDRQRIHKKEATDESHNIYM